MTTIWAVVYGYQDNVKIEGVTHVWDLHKGLCELFGVNPMMYKLCFTLGEKFRRSDELIDPYSKIPQFVALIRMDMYDELDEITRIDNDLYMAFDIDEMGDSMVEILSGIQQVPSYVNFTEQGKFGNGKASEVTDDITPGREFLTEYKKWDHSYYEGDKYVYYPLSIGMPNRYTP